MSIISKGVKDLRKDGGFISNDLLIALFVAVIFLTHAMDWVHDGTKMVRQENYKHVVQADSREVLEQFIKTVQKGKRVQVFGSDDKIHLSADNKYEGNKLRVTLRNGSGERVVRYVVEPTRLLLDGKEVAKLAQPMGIVPFTQDADRVIEVNLTLDEHGKEETINTKILRRVRLDSDKYNTWEEYQILYP